MTLVGGAWHITAVFKLVEYTVTVAGGTADKDSAAAGETVKLTANVPDGQAFIQWASDDVDSFDPPDGAVTEFAMPDKDVAVTAVCADILIELANDRWMFTGNPITPDEMKVSLDGVDLDLLYGRDYDVAFRDNVDVGNAAKVIVTMSDERGGQSATATFQITPANIADADVTVSDQEADGTEQKPDPIVTWNGKELEKGKDYEIVGYDNNVEPGLATVTVLGKGNFMGEVSRSFQILAPTEYTVTVTNDGNGTATADPTSGNKGQEVKLTAKPDLGYQFKEWQVVKGGVTITGDTFNIGTEDVEIKAIFEPIVYIVTKGADASYRLKSGKTVSLTVSRNIDDDTTESHLTGVAIGGKILTKGTDYTTVKGSVVITIKSSALDKLTVGKHPLTVTFDDGSAATEIQILVAYDDVTGTGDNSHMFLWLGLTVCGLLGLGGIYLNRRKWMEG